jgi:hypothetical protein
MPATFWGQVTGLTVWIRLKKGIPLYHYPFVEIYRGVIFIHLTIYYINSLNLCNKKALSISLERASSILNSPHYLPEFVNIDQHTPLISSLCILIVTI